LGLDDFGVFDSGEVLTTRFGTFKRVYEQFKPLWGVSIVDRELRADTLDHLEEKSRQGKMGGKTLTQ